MKIQPVVVAPDVFKESPELPKVGVVDLIVFTQHQIFSKRRFYFLVVVLQARQFPAHKPGDQKASNRYHQCAPHKRSLNIAQYGDIHLV